MFGSIFNGGSSQKYTVKTQGQHVEATKHYLRPAPAGGGEGEVRMLLMANDYKETKNPLTSSIDGHNIETLARACKLTDLVTLYDNECTKENVISKIEELGGRSGPNDYLVVYYSGHGTSVEDKDGDEEDGKDEAFCFVNEKGKVTSKTLMSDDDFAELVVKSTPETARIVILSDCCHSGTIADLDKELWGTREVISISGCLDSETSGDMGKGGICTHSILLAVDHLQDASVTDYSVGMMYNIALDFDDKIFKSAQNITIQCNAAVKPDKLAWPLVPTEDYQAPLTKLAAGIKPPDIPGGLGGEGAASSGEQQVALDDETLAQLGVSPGLAQYMNASNLSQLDISPDALIKKGLEFAKKGSKLCVVQ